MNGLSEQVASLELDCEIAETLAIKLQDEKADIYEALVGANGINRYTHNEIIERIHEMYNDQQELINKIGRN